MESNMDYLQTVLAAILSIAAMFIITKCIGCRQMSQMSLFDYVNGITIGSIGAELATALPHEILDPLIAMIVYGGISILLAWITNKSRRVAGIINGRPLILLRNGKLIKKSFKKARLDVDEFIMHCRSAGYFELDQVECVILEANGKLSIMPKSEHRPLTPQDMGVTVEKATLYTAVIMDGIVDWNRLREEGLDQKWLDKQLHAMDISSPKEVFYAAVSNGTLHAFPYAAKKTSG